jgi:hypothetical protein
MNCSSRIINTIWKNAIEEVPEVRAIVKVRKIVSSEVLGNYTGVQS